MRKYELTLSPDYIPTWTVTDAIREIYQNAIDEEQLDPENKVRTSYDGKSLLTISNTKSVLNTNTLLLGTSTKTENNQVIGQFGEGYKLAALVLLRLGKTMEIHNLGNAEIWRPRFVNSKRFGSQILTFFIEDITDTPDIAAPLLSFIISGITPEEYEEIVNSNLHLQKPTERRKTERGDILTDPKYAGKVFVNGLLIHVNADLRYGYDIKPQWLSINRDRRMVDQFDLLWCTSHMVASSILPLADLLDSDKRDAIYAYATVTTAIADSLYVAFIAKHGDNAVPVATHEEMLMVPKCYRPIIVSAAYLKVLRRSILYVAPELDSDSILNKLNSWQKKANEHLPTALQTQLTNIIAELEKFIK